MSDTEDPPQNLSAADLLRNRVDHANNLPYEGHDRGYYDFFVFHWPHPVGHIQPQFMNGEIKVHWPANFAVDHTKRTVKLAPQVSNEDYTKACRQAMIDFCQKNKANFPKAFGPWLDKPDQDIRNGDNGVTVEKKDYHGIIGLNKPLEGLCSATPARGIFGIVTAGVHVNVYEARVDEHGNERAISRVWLSKRTIKQTFPESFDQVAAGAVDDTDRMNRLSALKRELQSETTFKLDEKTMKVKDHNGKTCGELKPTEHVISIATEKGILAGVKEDGHLEYAIRFAYDLRIDPGCVPLTKEETTFFPVKVENLASEGFVKHWKYSSGAVFIDFIMRHNLMRTDKEAPEFRKSIWDRLHRDLPFQNAKEYQNWNKEDTY